MSAIAGNLLQNIHYPQDLRKLKADALPQLSKELRQYIIDVISENAGHFASSLGVVELTIALHYAYNTPYDQIVWDVGHQAYGHKILTGRRDIFHTNRKYKGISGFPVREESKYDTFGVGHASTSISAALGMAVAAKKNGENDRQVVAVVGDGALTGGLSFEGLNNAGMSNSNILVIVNDNQMAIDPNTGALSEYLLDITTSKTYNKLKDHIWKVLGKVGGVGSDARSIAQKLESGVKSFVLEQSNVFEGFNFRYFGPVDGHDVFHLTQVLNDLKSIKGPKVLHVLTQKGKGFKPAELDQPGWHAAGQFDKYTGKTLKIKSDKPQPPKFQDVFGHTIVDLAKQNEKIIGITPAMPTGSSLKIMMDKMPNRAYDVGIAEQHAVTFSAGLATQGFVPFCNIYSTFLQRAYDQVIHDVALQNLHVVFCIDRGGLVSGDGATHHGAFDLAYLWPIPNLTVSAPMNEEELRNLMYTAQLRDHGPFTIRYPRGNGVMPDWERPMNEIKIGKGRLLREGNDVAVLSLGYPGNLASTALDWLNEEEIYPAHYDMRFLKPMDQKILHDVFRNYNTVITVEDGAIKGGFGSAVLEFMADNNYSARVARLGIPDRFIEHGDSQKLYAECGFDEDSIYNTVKLEISTNEKQRDSKLRNEFFKKRSNQ